MNECVSLSLRFELKSFSMNFLHFFFHLIVLIKRKRLSVCVGKAFGSSSGQRMRWSSHFCFDGQILFTFDRGFIGTASLDTEAKAAFDLNANFVFIIYFEKSSSSFDSTWVAALAWLNLVFLFRLRKREKNIAYRLSKWVRRGKISISAAES